MAYDETDLRRIAGAGLAASPTTEVLLEESILGWKEYELEVMRDTADNVVIVCSIENLDPMGVHTGDSITVAPAMTLTDREYQHMRDIAIGIIRAVGVDTGGCNIQFAVEPARRPADRHRDEPAGLAVQRAGLEGDRLPDRQDRGQGRDRLHARRDPQRHHPRRRRRSFEPTLDYVVVKVPRFAFEKFPGADPTLTTHMKSVGEAMAIGRNFTEALQKALRSLEQGRRRLRLAPRVGRPRQGRRCSRTIRVPHDGRLQEGHGRDPGRRHRRGGLRRHRHRPVVRRPAAADQRGRRRGRRRPPSSTPELLRRAKRHGFSDAQIGQIRGMRRRRRARRPARARASGRSTRPSTPAPPSSPRATPYHYSSYDEETEVAAARASRR